MEIPVPLKVYFHFRKTYLIIYSILKYYFLILLSLNKLTKYFMRKFLAILVFVSAFLFFSDAQSQQKENSHLIKSYTYSITLPFEVVQNLIVIDNIIIDGRKGSFIFDTGNQAALVLNSVAFQAEILQEANRQTFTDTAKGITGNIPVTSNLKIDSLTIGNDFTFAGLDAVAFNLEYLRAAIGKNFLGFIGYGVLKEVEFAIDYNKKLIHIYRLNDTGNTIEETYYKRKTLLNFTVEKGSMMANVYFGGKMLNFFLDTGAPKNSLDASILQQLDKTYITFTGLKDTIIGGSGVPLETNDAIMTQLTIQENIFTNMSTNVYPFSGNAGYNATLGYPFFSQKVFAVNYKKRQLYICE